MESEQAPNSPTTAASAHTARNLAALTQPPRQRAAWSGLSSSSFLPPGPRQDLQALYDTLAALRLATDTSDFTEETREFLIECIEQALTGQVPMMGGETVEFVLPALRLAQIQSAGRLDSQWAQRLTQAARKDISRPTCATWSDLMLYCRYAAEPLGRAVLELHAVNTTLEICRATDALCAALLVLRLVRRMGPDWRTHGRCYLPTDWFAEAGGSPEHLVENRSSPAVLQVVGKVLRRTEGLLDLAAPLPELLTSPHLRAEAVRLLTIARRQLHQLQRHDPLRRHLRVSLFTRALARFKGWRAATNRLAKR